MRKYYYQNSLPFPGYSSRRNEMNETRKELLKKYDYNILGARIKGYFKGTIVSISKTYIYEENDVFYEFFSGKRIGSRQKGLEISSTNWYVSDRYMSEDFHELTPSQFSYDVERYMNHQKKIAKMMSDIIDYCSAVYQKESEEANRRQLASIRRDSTDASWLDDYLNKR